MTATADLAQLVHLVRANRWRLVAVGDPEQLPSVARGGVFAHWCNTVAHHTLDTPKRFSEPWEATASIGLRAGDHAAAQSYADHRRLHSSHPALVAAQVARSHQHHTASGRSVAITTNTAETAMAVNREIQRLTRRASGPGVVLRDGTKAWPGDRIATRRNDPRLRTDTGDRVRNRHTWTIQAVHADGAIVAADDQRGTVTLPADYAKEHVELGWAVTGYGNQGDTVDIGIAVLEPTSSRNHAYVAMTRGRQANHALILDSHGTTDPAERLAEIITRPARADSALATQQRLYRDAGVEPLTLDDMAEPLKSMVSDEPPTVAPKLDEKVAAITRRLDALQRRVPSRDGQGLGL